MNKKSLLWVLLDLVFLVVFNVIFFVVGGTDHTVSGWISYGFIHLAYAMVLVTPLLTRRSSSAAVFGFSLHSIAATYFLVELFVGVVFIALNQTDVKLALVAQVLLLGGFLVMLLSHLIANEHTGDATVRAEAEIAHIKDASIRLGAMLGSTNDAQAYRAIERAYDVVRTSPTRSDVSVAQYELGILDTIGLLEQALRNGDTAGIINASSRIANLASERNQRLRLTQR